MTTGTDGFARRKLLATLSAGWLAQGLSVLVRLGVPDLLADGPRTVDELAAATGADPAALHRLLRALSSARLFRQTAPGTFALDPVTELLRSDAPGSADLTALMYGNEVYRSFAELEYTLRTGRPAFEKVYGRPFYPYLEDNPDAAHAFNEAMGGQPVPAVLASCDLTGVGTLVDVGGGNGSLLASLLTEHADLRGVLVELPDAVRRARSRLDAAGLTDRVEFVEASFFDGVPTGGDVYVLGRVLHNWTDEHALKLLHVVHEAMAPGARLLVLEQLLPDGDATGAGAASAAMVDLLMLVTLEGRDRTEAEYRELLATGGFTVTAVREGAGTPAESVIEAVRT